MSTDIACTLCRYTEAFVCLENHREMYFPFTMKSQRLKEAIAIFLRLNKKKRRLNFFIRNEKRDRKKTTHDLHNLIAVWSGICKFIQQIICIYPVDWTKKSSCSLNKMKKNYQCHKRCSIFLCYFFHS